MGFSTIGHTRFVLHSTNQCLCSTINCIRFSEPFFPLILCLLIKIPDVIIDANKTNKNIKTTQEAETIIAVNYVKISTSETSKPLPVDLIILLESVVLN